MKTNRDILAEAIAEAKILKETAIENAKASLTESFAPHLKSMFNAKLQEMEMEDDVEEAYELTDPEKGEVVSSLPDEIEMEIDESEDLVDLDELLNEIEGNEDLEEAKKDEEADEKEAEPEEAESTEETEEELNIEDMSEEDLKGFIEDVINDMIETGELEPGEGEPEEAEEGEEEIDIENVGNDETEELDETFETNEELEDESVTNELEEAYNTINILRKEINESRILNSKLLYTNKIFKAKQLTEGKKLQVLHAFDKVKSVKEAKTTYEILSESLNDKKTIREPFKGAASKTLSVIKENRQPIMEVDSQFARWQKLAGIE